MGFVITKFEWQEVLSKLPAGRKKITVRNYKRLLPKGVRLMSVNRRKIFEKAWIYIGDDILLECDIDEDEDRDLINEVEKRSLL